MINDEIKFRKILTRAPNTYPRFLYKYKSTDPLDHIRDVIINSRLWFSTPADFNDPFDTKVKISASGSTQDRIRRIEKAIKRSGFPNHNKRGIEIEAAKQYAQLKRSGTDLTTLAQNSHENTMRTTGIVCFSEDSRNILLWSHYATYHQGICFQFGIVADENNFLRALSVKYADNYPTHDWVKDDDNRLLEGIYTKFSDWKYERERRITLPDRGHTYLNFVPASLTGLIYGCKMQKSIRTKIRDLIEERTQRSLPPIKEYDAVQSQDSYKLRIYKAS